jgi:hypothetical protein
MGATPRNGGVEHMRRGNIFKNLKEMLIQIGGVSASAWRLMSAITSEQFAAPKLSSNWLDS